MTRVYTPLHVHSDCSLLDGLSQPNDIAQRIEAIDANGCALTDHGSISNCVAFLQAMKKVNKKPVLGIELYVCDEHASVRTQDNRSLTHLPILAKNTAGWNQLVQLVSESNLADNYYHKPRLSLEQLAKYLDGNIIGFSGHLGSHVSNAIENIGKEAGIHIAKILQSMFGIGNFWLECQLMDNVNTPKQRQITKIIREIGKELNIPCIATPDAHYAKKEDAILQRILLCSNLGTNFNKAQNENFGMRTFFVSDNFHIPSYDEMISYGHTKEELENTNKILEQIEPYQVLKPPMLKQFECPGGMTPNEYLRHLCRLGWKKLIADNIPKEQQQVYIDRIKEELDVLQEAKLASYFLIVQDILSYVRSEGWLPGPGRGSAAGCLVSYLIGITNIDPIKHNLLFSRFYNKGRNVDGHVAMPDIDIDVPIHVREQTIDYIKSKYGNDNVSQMITYQTMKGARSLKEVFRAYDDITFENINAMTKHVVEESKIADQLQQMDDPSIIMWCLENRDQDFKDWCTLNEKEELTGPYAERFDQAIRLEGTKAAQSKHAAGIVIAPRPLAELCPMVYDSKTKKPVAGMEMQSLEAIGLMKLDLLGVAALSKLMHIAELCDFKPNFNEIDFNCKQTWDLLSSGKTKGCFQLESKLGQHYAKKLQPRNIDHLSALMAILRPGCIGKDTQILIRHYSRLNKKHCCVKMSIENLYQKFHKNHNLFRKDIISYDEESNRLVQNKIVNVFYNGKRDVYKLNFKKKSRNPKHEGTRKYSLTCTLDHPLFVYGKGWTPLENLQSGDRFAILSDGESSYKPKYKKHVDGKSIFRDICFYNYQYKCIYCNWNEGSLDVNHLEGNRWTNNEIDNLCFMCPNHHRMYTENKLDIEDVKKKQQQNKLPHNDDIVWGYFLGYEFVEEQDVYDIQVEGPHHNFIAGDVIVHNCLEAKEANGKSVTDNYIDIKNLESEPEHINELLVPILQDTYSKMIYQEQAMRIAKELAGFTLEEADEYIRKGIGKKKPELIAKAKELFLAGCAKLKTIDDETSKIVFNGIEKSQRYAFNASHSYSYAYTCYMTAYAKTHYPKEFFTAYLKYSNDKLKPQQEIYELVNDAKDMCVYVMPPSLYHMNKRFKLIDGKIYFGLCDVKNVGESVVESLCTLISQIELSIGKKCKDWSWVEFLILAAPKIKINSLESLINVGACDYFKKSRTEMMYELTVSKELNAREIQWVTTNMDLGNDNLHKILKTIIVQPTGRLGACSNKNRLSRIKELLTMLESPPYQLIDKPHQIAQMEYELLGVSLTANILDECRNKYKANCTCLDYNMGVNSDNICIAVKIDLVKKTKTKNGKNPGEEMAFLEASDETGFLNNLVVFPNAWAELKYILVEGNRVLLSCGKSPDKKRNSLIINDAQQI